MKVTYNERYYTDKFTCIDYPRTVYLHKSWRVGGLLYGYVSEFQVVAISMDMITNIEEV